MTDLPDYERPPVTEVVIAVQSVPVPQFGMREAVAVARAFEDWELVDVGPALQPIVEAPAGQPVAGMFQFVFATPPSRVILSQSGEHWLAQVQQDRVAAQNGVRCQRRPEGAGAAPRGGGTRATAT